MPPSSEGAWLFNHVSSGGVIFNCPFIVRGDGDGCPRATTDKKRVAEDMGQVARGRPLAKRVAE